MLEQFDWRLEPGPTQLAAEHDHTVPRRCGNRKDRPLTPTKAPPRNTTHDNGARALPDDPRAERGLLGAALLSTGARDIAATVPPDAYYSPAHSHIAHAITALHLDGRKVDTVTVAAQLAGRGLLEQVGGGDYIVHLHNNVPSISSAPQYAEIILAAWRRRKAIYLAAEIDTGARAGLDITGHISDLTDLEQQAGVDELALDDIVAALDTSATEQPTILTRDDGKRLLYEQAVNMLQSEPTIGKSFIALIACAEIMDEDAHVLYLDYEDTPGRIARRLVHSLGVTIDQLAHQFHYKRLSRLTPQGVAGLPRLADSLDTRLVVIDGLAEALAVQGYDENAAADVAAWWNTTPRPLADTGACVLILDHVTKSRENRGRWARGSGHKLAALDGVCYTVEAIQGFARHHSGRLKLVIAKDRPGVIGAVGENAAEIDMIALEDGEGIQWKTTAAHTGEWQGPTDCMALVRQLFTEHPDLELARSAIAGHLKTIYDKGYRDRTVREAADRLATEGVLATRAQGKRGTYFRLSTSGSDTSEEELWEQF